MERAAAAAVRFIIARYSQARPITIFAGPGNNGGDGLAIARKLSHKGYNRIRVYLFNTNNTLSTDCQQSKLRLADEAPEVSLTEVVQQFEAPQLSPDEVIIDALFGTGLNKPLGGGFAALVKFINASGAEVISIDMPSGLMSEDNTLNSPSAIIRANLTLTLGLPKLSLLLADSQPYLGDTYLLPIGLDAEAIGEIVTPYSITEPAQIQAMIKKRPPFGHKGTFGNGLLIAGKYGMAGCAVLAARACLKAGVGKVTIHTPTRNNDILQVAVPEAIVHHDANERIFTSPLSTDAFQALAIGPGIGTEKETAVALIEQLSHATGPLIIDADAIHILAEHKGWIPQVPDNAIFTPHPGELQHLGICNGDSYSILLEAINLAQRHSFYMVLKGHFTAICTPQGHVYFNPTGGDGMATAGSGDVLTGILLALTAQGYSAANACRLGVYLHGLAGDLATEQLGAHSVTASSIIDFLPHAFARLQEPVAELNPTAPIRLS